MNIGVWSLLVAVAMKFQLGPMVLVGLATGLAEVSMSTKQIVAILVGIVLLFALAAILASRFTPFGVMGIAIG